MDRFYSIDENFKFLYSDVYILLSNTIVESSISENWLVDWYASNRYNTTRAIEICAANLLIPKIRESEIPHDSFKAIIEKKLNGCCESYNDIIYTLDDKLYMINNIQKMSINESTLSYIIQDFECDDVIEYIGENHDLNNQRNYISQLNDESKQILGIISEIKHFILEHKDNFDELNKIKDYNTHILYSYKYVTTESNIIDLSDTYIMLNILLNEQTDEMIKYTLDELNHCNILIEHFMNCKDSDEFIYEKAIETFDIMVENIFFQDTEIEMDELITLCKLTEAICDYETTMEASSRIIRKGTEKVTNAIGRSSSKSRGMSNADSKVDQVKRGAKIVDDRASDAINKKIDQMLNFTREQKREKIITGKNTIRLSKMLKTVILLIATKGLIKGHPAIGLATTIIGLLGGRALSKATEVREKKRILLDLETELKITKEKIEDAKGDNAKEKKYQLMRIEAQLEKEIFRIKHGMKYY